MLGTLKLTGSELAYNDPKVSNQPLRQFFNWTTGLCVSVINAKGDPFTIQPGATTTLFSGLRTISADGTTQWTLALNPTAPTLYRVTNTGGTAPALRADRGVSLTGTLTITVNANQTATFVAGSSVFGTVQIGDTLFIPGLTTGDSAGPFNALNEGFWTILSTNGTTTLQVARPGAFSAYGQVVTVAPSNIDIFGSAGVQVGDGVSVSAGFAAPVLGHYTVVAVTPTWFEFTSTGALPILAVATPGANGIQFYGSAKRWVKVYADQALTIQLNGSSGTSNSITPWQAGDPTQLGSFEQTGLVWQVVVINNSPVVCNLLQLSVE